MKICKLFFLLACILVLAGCSQGQAFLFGEPAWEYTESGEIRLRIMTYNVENLFNAVYDGDEYPEYDPRQGSWDLSGYHLRLARLRDVLLSEEGRGADVILFQEIEHKGVLRDLVTGYLPRQGYEHIAATNLPGSAIEVGIISRIPIAEVTFHSSQLGDARAPRPIMEAVLDSPWGHIHVFNGHWKSKIGGAEQTEAFRLASSSSLRSRISQIKAKHEKAYIVAGGDFNGTPWDYSQAEGAYPTALQIYDSQKNLLAAYPHSVFLTGEPADLEAGEVLFSPWLAEELDPPGSYLYRGQWEAIDHLLICDLFFSDTGIHYSSAEIQSEGLLDSLGAPKSWDLPRREGFSDHLPLIITAVADPDGL